MRREIDTNRPGRYHVNLCRVSEARSPHKRPSRVYALFSYRNVAMSERRIVSRARAGAFR